MECLRLRSCNMAGKAARLPVHLEIDTGMARQGVAPGEGLQKLLHWLKRQPRLVLDGVMTHFASPEELGRLRLCCSEEVRGGDCGGPEAGFRPGGWVHAGSSSTVDNQDAAANLAWLRSLPGVLGRRSIVRSGIALYGIVCRSSRRTLALRPGFGAGFSL